MAKPPPIVGRSAIAVAFSEAARNWPFVFGFAVTMGLVTWISKNLDHMRWSNLVFGAMTFLFCTMCSIWIPKDAQKSPFINPNAHR